ncbi:adenylate isopentenyltransferase 5, chloroplastic [Ricinus communis]|uniref:adenylate isopentenyltransferase 5, chloroplastic n=1 Tax=Ricinus communis TaxID=3988 RepID=UPI00201B19BE|nr:adenylate isopentenyltransferase 5, chloroplastic [Ricinus communis]
MEFAVSSMTASRLPMSSPLLARMRKWSIIRSSIQSTYSTLAAIITNTTGRVENQVNKKKTVFILGATATGKSKLSVDLASHFDAEIINSDKIQVYKGLDIVTNKIPEDNRKGIPHHLLGFMDPEADFTAQDFCNHVCKAMTHITEYNGRVPIIVGGSNNFIRALVEDPHSSFKANYDSCFLWMDVALPVLYKHVGKRVDQMVKAGLVDEVRETAVSGSDYTRGVWRAIGLPEMHEFYYAEKTMSDENTKKMLLDAAIDRIKENTCRLVDAQLGKIDRMIHELGWKIHRIDATCVVEKSEDEAVEAWNKVVLKPSIEIVRGFLEG